MTTSLIGHLDMDAFFAAIEERDTPRFRGQPLVVGANPQWGRGVVSTANYIARTYGIHSAMSIRQAWRLSQAARLAGQPPVIFVPGNYRRYSAASQKIMTILSRYTPCFQQRSIDEAYFDLSHCASTQAALKLAQQIQASIQAEEHLPSSIGIGPNKLIAKIASDAHKPNGLVLVEPSDIDNFLLPLPLQVIPGVGPKTTQLLHNRGLVTIAQARAWSRDQLTELLGQWGSSLYDKLRGVGSCDLSAAGPALSLSEQTTLRADTLSPLIIIPTFLDIVHHLLERLHNEGFTSYRTVTVIIRFANFQTTSKRQTYRVAGSSYQQLSQQVLSLALPFLDHRQNPTHSLLRLVGVRLEKLSK